ncbi:MAG: hypothetical protein ACPG5Z_03805 [Pseudoalteromonas sp.]
MNQSKRISAVLALSLTLIVGCSDNEPTEQEVVANVALKSMSSVDNEVYQPGQEITVDFSTETTLLTNEHVGVSFILIERSKVSELETEEEPDGYDLGEFYIEQLQEGEQNHSAKLILPNEDLSTGEFVIAAFVDTSGVISNEADVTDNKSRGIESGDETTYSSIAIKDGRYHDFVLQKVKVGDGFAIFPGPGKRDTSGGGQPTHKVPDLIGFVNAKKFGDSVKEADISATITIGDNTYDAHLWNELEQTYGDTMKIVFPDHEQSHYFPWDVAVNGELLKAIHDNFDRESDKNSFSMTFTFQDDSAEIEDDKENNSITVEVPYVLYHDEVKTAESAELSSKKTTLTSAPASQTNASAATSLAKVGSWSGTYGDSDAVAISPSFYSYMNVTSSNGGSAEALVEADLDLYLFDKSASLVSASAEASANVSDGEITYAASFSVLGDTLIDEGDTLTALDKSLGYSWSEEQKVVETTFTIVIVPVTVEAGVSGSLDLGIGLAYGNSRIDLGGDIVSASMDAYASAEINLGVASGGVGIDFLIIADTFNATLYADLAKAITDSKITLGIDVTNDIEAISGEFYVYVKYPKYKWCCKIKTKTKTQTIYDTGTLYDKSWTILEESATLNY